MKDPKATVIRNQPKDQKNASRIFPDKDRPSDPIQKGSYVTGGGSSPRADNEGKVG